MARTRILLADDHKEIRDRVVGMLEPEFEVVGALEDGCPLLEAATKMKPDVCILDISMPLTGGIEAAAKLKESGLTTKIIFLTVHQDNDFVRAALETGALGYVVKSRMCTDLRAAINGAMAGRLFISPSCTFIFRSEMVIATSGRFPAAAPLRNTEFFLTRPSDFRFRRSSRCKTAIVKSYASSTGSSQLAIATGSWWKEN